MLHNKICSCCFYLFNFFLKFFVSLRRGGSIAKSAQELSLALQDVSWVKGSIAWIIKSYILDNNRDIVHMEWLLELWSGLHCMFFFFYLAELASCMYIPAKMKTLTTHSLINWLVIARGQLLCTAAAPNVAGNWTCMVEDPSYLFSSNPEYLIFTCWFVIIGYLSKIMYPYDNFCINTRVSKPSEIWKILSVIRPF